MIHIAFLYEGPGHNNPHIIYASQDLNKVEKFVEDYPNMEGNHFNTGVDDIMICHIELDKIMYQNLIGIFIPHD